MVCQYSLEVGTHYDSLVRLLKTYWRIQGSNWIPADSFLSTVTEDRYRSWLQLLKDGNQNMVRVWGGGVYESDIFYDICDGEYTYLSHANLYWSDRF